MIADSSDRIATENAHDHGAGWASAAGWRGRGRSRSVYMPNGLAVSSFAGRQPVTVVGRYLL
jgi:hypothetical protein